MFQDKLSPKKSPQDSDKFPQRAVVVRRPRDLLLPTFYADLEFGPPARQSLAKKLLVKKIKAALPDFLEEQFSLFSQPGRIGYIQYGMEEKCAVPSTYFPKQSITWTGNELALRHTLVGFGYFFEKMCCEELKRDFGAMMVSTTFNPDPSRIGQLRKVNLPIDRPVGIDSWMEALEYGIDLSRNKYFENKALIEDIARGQR